MDPNWGYYTYLQIYIKLLLTESFDPRSRAWAECLGFVTKGGQGSMG